MKQYYEAYDLRYKQVHEMNLQWTQNNNSPIVERLMEKYQITKESSVLELGCGEGRDAIYLMERGYNVQASDISQEAVEFCRRKAPKFGSRFFQLNACQDRLEQKFDFIYSVAVIHMLVLQEDRDAFLTFIKEHLKEGGIALILTMGDGEVQRSSDVTQAFENQTRVHGASGQEVSIAATSCRMVSFDTFRREQEKNGLTIVEQGLTAVEPEFSCMMYAVVK